MKLITAAFTNFNLLQDLKIDFSSDDKKNLTVIRGDNDSGKTTILTALQWCLYGEESLPIKQNKFRMSSFNKSGDVDIIVEIYFEHSERGIVKRYNAMRSIIETPNAEENSYPKKEEKFQLSQITDEGNKPIHNPNIKLNQILGSNLRELFFIDGDKAMTFVDTSNQTSADARSKVKKAIQDMLNMEVLNKSKDRISTQKQKIKRKLTESSGSKDVEDLHKNIENLDSEIKKIKQDLIEYDNDLMKLNKEEKNLEQKRDEILKKGNKEELSNQLQKRNEMLKTIEKQVYNSDNNFAREHYSKSVFSALLSKKLIASNELLSTLKKEGKFPKSVYPALEELLNEKKCVCGDELKPNSDKFKYIQEIIKNRESTDEFDDYVNTLRYKSSEFINDGKSAFKKLDNLRSKSDEAHETRKKLENEISDIVFKIKNIPDANIKSITDNLDSLKTNIRYKYNNIYSLRTELENKEKDLEKANQQYENESKKLDKYHEFKNKLKASDDMLKVLISSYELIEDNQIPQVNDYLKEYFLKMSAAGNENQIISDVKLTNSHEIVIIGSKGERINTTHALNGANKRALTLSFCLALTKVTESVGPLIIDTPLGMMDNFTKNKCLEVLVENSNQLILFLTRSEIRDVEDNLNKFTGKFQTITNTEHYYGTEKKLSNKPDVRNQTIECDCNIFQFCKKCERIDEKENPDMKEIN